MNRRTVLALGGTVVTGGTIAADALRADIFVESDLHRGQGGSVSIEMAADSVNEEEKTDGIEENEGTESRANQASEASRKIARNRVMKTVNERLDAEIEGVTSSISHLIFGPVITLNHIVSHE